MQQSPTDVEISREIPSEWTQDEIFTAGQRAPAGVYADVDAPWRRRVQLSSDDILPASLDGRVALYRRLPVLRHIRGAASRRSIRSRETHGPSSRAQW